MKSTLPTDAYFYSFTMAPQVYDGMVMCGQFGRGVSRPRICPGL